MTSSCADALTRRVTRSAESFSSAATRSGPTAGPAWATRAATSRRMAPSKVIRSAPPRIRNTPSCKRCTAIRSSACTAAPSSSGTPTPTQPKLRTAPPVGASTHREAGQARAPPVSFSLSARGIQRTRVAGSPPTPSGRGKGLCTSAARSSGSPVSSRRRRADVLSKRRKAGLIRGTSGAFGCTFCSGFSPQNSNGAPASMLWARAGHWMGSS